MSDLVVVANRSPVKLSKNAHGELEIQHSIGGVAPSLMTALGDTKADWVATALTEEDVFAAESNLPIDLDGINVRFVVLPEDVLDLSYTKVANESLWFLCHGLFNATYGPVFNESFFTAWAAYRLHNEKIAEDICESASYGAKVLVNDYHFFLVGKYLKEKRPDLKTTYFLHTPFPTFDELTVLPREVAKELLGSMLDYGSCGFHTQRWQDRYTEAVGRMFGCDAKSYVAPLGVDVAALREKTGDPVIKEQAEEFLQRFAEKKIIYRTDRMEPSKNLLRGFLAFEELLSDNPSLNGRAVFFARSYLSREKSSHYQMYKKEVLSEVERINKRFGEKDPVIELISSDNYNLSLAGMLTYDALLVNPIRDGMNLVAKEGVIINPKNSPLILSQEAGSYEEMQQAVLSINPYDVSETADAMKRALEMGEEEKVARSTQLRRILEKNQPVFWLSRLIEQAV